LGFREPVQSVPHTFHRILLKNIVGTDKQHITRYGLGDNDAVERIAMNQVQAG